MIHVEKPGAPQRLNRGEEVTERNCEEFEANSVDYQNGSKTFTFDRDIYGHHTVRKALKDCQHAKCCFCEGKFTTYAAGDVEHYRPKGVVRQDKNSAALKPGYFWLAYAWENLYWSCQTCNRSNKRDLFPLICPGKRALSHNDDLAREEPLIVDPGGRDDPRKHIAFRQDRAVGSTQRGRTTILVVGLNRLDLVEARLTRLGEIKRLVEIVGFWEKYALADLKELASSARRELDKATARESMFSAMVADYLSALPMNVLNKPMGQTASDGAQAVGPTKR